MIELIKTGLVPDDGKFNYNYWYNRCLIDLDKIPKEPDILMSIGESDDEGEIKKNPTFTRSEMSVLTAHSKSKKTYMKSVLVSSYIGGKVSNLFPQIKTTRKKDLYVIDIDTEQGEYYASKAMKRVETMCGFKYDNYLPFGIKQIRSNEDRLQFIKELTEDHKYRGKIGLLSIDGVADICKNVNDLDESEKVINQLLDWTEKGIHVLNVIHKNPNSDKIKGHLGSLIVPKSETVIELSNTNKRKKNAPIHVVNRDSRGPGFIDFHFKLNEFGIPYCTDYEDDII
jgi:hypothetical protein